MSAWINPNVPNIFYGHKQNGCLYDVNLNGPWNANGYEELLENSRNVTVIGIEALRMRAQPSFDGRVVGLVKRNITFPIIGTVQNGSWAVVVPENNCPVENRCTWIFVCCYADGVQYLAGEHSEEVRTDLEKRLAELEERRKIQESVLERWSRVQESVEPTRSDPLIALGCRQEMEGMRRLEEIRRGRESMMEESRRAQERSDQVIEGHRQACLERQRKTDNADKERAGAVDEIRHINEQLRHLRLTAHEHAKDASRRNSEVYDSHSHDAIIKQIEKLERRKAKLQ